MYGGGLRVSEVVRLRLEDLDENRGLIHIRAQEGRKARQTLLSTVALQAVKAYVNCYRPDQWLFPGATPGCHLSISTVEKVLATARKKADIPQKITPRIVRHSFAVHLLEAGINVRYVQVLIGHENVKSTQVYNLVSKKRYQQIQNPLDALFKEEVNKKMNP